jgi:hypothetical protein
MSMLRNRYVYRKEAEEGEDLGGGEEAKAEEKADDKAEPEVSAEIIAKAEKMGWTPKSEFRGDPAKWRPADEFVERGENMLPLVRAQVRRQEHQIAELNKTVKEFADYASKSEARALEKALLQLRQERADAIAKADGVAFDKVDAEIRDLQKKADAKIAPKNQIDGEQEAVFNEWLGRNSWANDPKLQAYGSAIADELRASGETAQGIALLDMVTKRIKKDFPRLSENPRRDTASAVEGGAGPRKTGGKSYADMPADARAACDRMAKNGYADNAKEMAVFKASYVKNYFEEA